MRSIDIKQRHPERARLHSRGSSRFRSAPTSNAMDRSRHEADSRAKRIGPVASKKLSDGIEQQDFLIENQRSAKPVSWAVLATGDRARPNPTRCDLQRPADGIA